MLWFEHELPLIAINLVAVMIFLEHEFILSTMSGNCQPLQYNERHPHQEKVRSRPNGSNLVFKWGRDRMGATLHKVTTLAASRVIYFLFCEELRQLSSAFRYCRIFVPNIKIENWKLLPHPVNSQHSTFNSQLSGFGVASFFIKSFFDMFPSFFPFWNGKERENDRITSE